MKRRRRTRVSIDKPSLLSFPLQTEKRRDLAKANSIDGHGLVSPTRLSRFGPNRAGNELNQFEIIISS